MNRVTWFNYTDTVAEMFKVYRAIPGFEFRFSTVNTIKPEFKFSATSPDVQTLVLDTKNTTTLVASLNKGKGILARKTTDGLSIQVRLTAQGPQARLKIYGSTFADDIGLAPNTIIVPGLNFKSVGMVSYTDSTAPYIFNDFDGTQLDWYYITSVTANVESLPSFIQKPMLPGVDYCMAEARFINVQGRPVRGVEVTLEPALLDGADFSTNKVTVVSDAYGRVAIPLIQGQDYVLHIPAIGYNQFITAPAESFLDITKWAASTKPEMGP